MDGVDYDVIVVGGGAAGLYTALCVSAHLRVALITKDTLSLSASDWAQGGIAAALGPDDSAQLHVADTLKAGAGLCEPEAVAHLAEAAKDCIDHLLRLGVIFDRHGSTLAMTLEAAHSKHRVLHAADTTGRAIVSILAERVLERSNITVLERGFVLDLWCQRDRCRGVVLAQNQQISWLAAQATVLATGGGGQLYAYTTNPAGSTGDGVAMAWRAGALLRDLEFVQFHPTALAHPEALPFLISEAVRGEGAHLVDSQGVRFVFAYHPQGELAPRDVVSRAIFQHMQRQQQPHVWLDMRPIPADRLSYRFPNILGVCRRWGIDPLRDRVPVAPAAHYWMGGIVTDLTSRTALAGLYAVGENASTGVHGANRLASNSLLECLVYGAELAQLTLVPQSARKVTPATELTGLREVLAKADISQLIELRSQLNQLLWQSAGICRDAATLAAALETLAEQRRQWQQQPLSQILTRLPVDQAAALPPETADRLRQWGELTNLYDTGWLVLRSAHFRAESRGGHYRSDFPAPDPHWQRHTQVQRSDIQRSEPIGS